MDLKKAREALSDSQKEVEKEKTLLVAAKKQATEASEAARQAELALRGQAGLESLKSPLGLAATSGWTLAGIIAVTRKKKQDEDEVGGGGEGRVQWASGLPRALEHMPHPVL